MNFMFQAKTQSDESMTIQLPGGRVMGYASYSSPSNRTIFVFHGTPGSQLFGNILADAATVEGIRLIAPERPSYGLSISHPAPLLALPDDVAVLADKLGIERFSVLGVSGGGALAMACASTY